MRNGVQSASAGNVAQRKPAPGISRCKSGQAEPGCRSSARGRGLFMKRLWKTLLWTAVAVLLTGVIFWAVVDHKRGSRWTIAFVRSRFPEIRQVSTAELETRLQTRQPGAPQPVLLDARTAEEFAVSHLPGAVHLDVDKVTSEALSGLSRQEEVIVYCSAGYRSCQLARKLVEQGFPKVWNLEGGLFAWANEGRKLHRGDQPVSEVHPYHPFFTRLLKPEVRQP